MGFKRKATKSLDKTPENRMTFDNKMLLNIQVKELSAIVSEALTTVIDADTIPYRAAAKQDDNYVEVKHIASGNIKEFKNKTEFKGGSRKEGVITQNSWLGRENMKRESAGKPLFTLDQFEIIPKKRLISDEDTCKENIRVFIDEYLSAIKEQTCAKDILCLLGGGDNFRHLLPLPKPYKGNRDNVARPLLLKYAREYLMEKYPHEMLFNEDPAKNREADDRGQQYMWMGYQNYKQTGKFNYLLAALDKDARQSAGLLFDYNKHGEKWLNCNPWLIEDVGTSIGEMEMNDKGECKATGLRMVAYQLICGDSADNYNLYLNFPKDMHPKTPYSDAAFFKDFYSLDTPEKILDKVVEVFYNTFPKGLKFTDHTGAEQDFDTLTWLETLFTCVYMLRKEVDKTTFKGIMDYYKVDYSCLVDNNLPEKPKKVVPESEVNAVYLEVCSDMFEVSELLEKQTGKKSDLTDRMTEAKVKLENIWIKLGNGLFEEEEILNEEA